MKKILLLLTSFFLINSASADNIKAKQILKINITGVPASEKSRIENAYPVSDSGYITLWMIGSVKVTGQTTDQLAANIAARYRAAEIYTNPTFIVMSDTAGGEVVKRFTVGGQVRAAGPKAWTQGMTLYGAVQAAGGETPYGAVNRVKLYRNGKVYTYNLKIAKHKAIPIYKDDVIEVPQSNWLGN